MDIVDKMMAWETDQMSEAEAVEFFQELVSSGLVWNLQGEYGRTAKAMIEAGLVVKP